MNKLKLLSLFSGLGAFEMGLNNIGVDYEVVSFCEFDKYASKSYSLIHNISKDLNLGDINNVDEQSLPDFDLMTYGFPCQSFSVQGRRLGFDDPTKGNLFFESMRIARYKKPKYMIAENVKGLTHHDNGNTFNTIINTLDFIGYNNYYQVLNSVNFNIPQSRERIYIVSIRKDVDNKLFKFPKGKTTQKSVRDILDDDSDRKQVKLSLQKYIDKKYFTKQYNSKNGIVKLFDGCAEGYFTSSYSSNRIFSINGVSPTLTTKNDAVYYEILGHLTQRERFALQGMKKEYADLLKGCGIPKGEIDKMSGNSITVNLIQEVLNNLLNAQNEILINKIS